MEAGLSGSFFPAVSLLCVAVAAFGGLYTLFAAACVRHFAAVRAQPVAARPGVTLLKPLHGAESGLFAALATFCTQDYAGPLHVVFGVQAADDPAIAVVRGLAAAYPACDIDLVIDSTDHGSNHKVSNLINMSARIRHEVVMLADGDILAGPDHVAQVVAELFTPGVGLVTCLYRGVANAGLWSRLTAAAIDLHFLPSVLVGLATGLAHPCFGSTIALRRDTLAAIGGFRPIADQLADDYAIGAAVRRLGLAVAVPAIVVGHLCQDASFPALWRHELRWARTIRLVDPVGFFGSGLTHPLPLALAGAIFSGFAPFATVAAAGVLGCRMLLKWSVARYLAPDIAEVVDFRLLILRDMLSFAIFVASFFAFRVRWRDLDYRVALGGTLVPLKEDLER